MVKINAGVVCCVKEDGTESYRAPKSVFHGVVSLNAQQATRRAVRKFRPDHQNVPSGIWMPDGAEGTKEHRGAEDVVQPKRRGFVSTCW